MHLLDGPRLKLRRAKKHLDSAQDMIEDFLAGKPYTFVIEPNPNPPDYLVIARINRSAPDDELGIIIGDFAHNARSALDHIVHGLSNIPLGDKRYFHIQFPICDCPKSYGSYRDSYLTNFIPNHEAILEKFQPYKGMNGSNNDPLGILRAINDADKHRIIHVVGSVAEIPHVGFRGQLGSNIMLGNSVGITVSHGGRITSPGFTFDSVGDGIITEDRTVIAKVTSDMPLQMDMHSTGQITVKFREGDTRVKGRPIVETLTLVYDRVEEVIGEFEDVLRK